VPALNSNQSGLSAATQSPGDHVLRHRLKTNDCFFGKRNPELDIGATAKSVYTNPSVVKDDDAAARRFNGLPLGRKGCCRRTRRLPIHLPY
jgi:hypothetical protein